jgi:hypothetical protein
MNEHSHLKNLINLGFLVDDRITEKIENLNEEEFFKLIEGLKKESIFIVNENVLKTIVSDEVKVLSSAKRMESFNIQDFVRTLNERYVFLQNILMKKLELSNIVSINKCSDGAASIIGMVKEKEEKGDKFIAVLEDTTGEVQVSIQKKLGEKISLDDVIAVSGEINSKVLNADKIIFPDVPLKPVVFSNDSIRVAFTDKDVKADYNVYDNKIKDMIKKKEIEISNPSIFKIGNVIFLMLLGFDPLDVLKKRYVTIENNDFLIEPSPDIVFTDKDINTNYKGISIVSENKIIDLKTRETQSI